VVRGFVVHAVVFAVVCTLLTAVYFVTTSSPLAMADITADPIGALRDGFWPLWFIGAWGAALAIHFALVATAVVFGTSRRARRRAVARQLRTGSGARRHGSTHAPRAIPEAPVNPSASTSSIDGHALARDATRAAFGLVESIGQRIAQPRQPAPQPPPAPPAAPSAGAPAAASAAATPAPPRSPSGHHWVAAMFTDIVGSTDLTETLGDEAWSRVLREHRLVVRACVSAHGGREVGTQGDGFLVRFDHALDAVACAVAIERRLDENRRRGSFTPEVKIGIHAGEAFTADDDDLVGRVVNLASRITMFAGPGEIVVTEPVADRLGPNVRLVDRGLQQLKGISQPRHLLAVAWREDDGAATRPADPTVAE
jgi:class 3 adenylate cyclase